MSKRHFRPDNPVRPRYPTLGTFARSRRDFLVGLGASLLSAGTLAALAGCDGRAVLAGTDGTTPPPPGDGAPTPDARPEGPVNLGGRPEPHAELDRTIDAWQEPDAGQLDAGAPIPSPGYAPLMDAMIDDSGSCPNP